jgi:hypothetical protein
LNRLAESLEALVPITNLQEIATCLPKTLQIRLPVFRQSLNLLNGLGILHGRLIGRIGAIRTYSHGWENDLGFP